MADSYTKLLIHADGVDGSQTFTDSSQYNHTITANGIAQIDDAQSKFGGTSARFSAFTDYLSIGDSDDWDLGSGDFTIDCWVRLNSSSPQTTICSRVTSGSSYFYLSWEGGSLRFRDFGGTIDFSKTVTEATNTWFHLAIVRNGNDFMIFVDGVQQGTTYTSSDAMIDRGVALEIGRMSQNASYYINGWIDEFRWSKGIARWTTDFTPPTSPYADSLEATIEETLNLSDDWTVQTNPENTSIDETLTLDDDWTVQTNPEQEAIAETLSLSDSWTITRDVHTDYASKIISYNPLIYVTNTDPAKIAEIDITDPENPVKDVHTITGCKYAQDVILNDTSDYFYVICAEGKVAKIEKANLDNQTVINTGETDNLILGAILEDYFKTYIATDDANGEIVMIDEATLTSINTDLRFIQRIDTFISTQINTILGKLLNTDLRFKAKTTKSINTDLRWIKYAYSSISQHPIDFDDIVVKINGTDLCPLNDVDLKSVIITENIDDEEETGSQTTFTLNRRHDKPDYDNQGNSSQITNNNTVIIIINGITEFTGKISNWHGNSETETIQITAQGERPSDNRKTVSIPMSSLNSNLHLYDCLINDVTIDNPYIDPNSENPEYYKGIEVDLGVEIEQNILKFQSFQEGSSLAESIESGAFQPKQNFTYFWFAKFRNFVTNRVQATLVYLGTSLGSMSSDTYTMTSASYKYQKQLEDSETELGTYQVGSAPYNVISVKNGKKIVKDKYEDKEDGLYITRDEGYDYTQFAQDVADLEYQKIQNINGDVLPITSVVIDLSLNAYYYYGIKLLTRINITNTTTANVYKSANGFPVAVKTITINLGTMTVSLNCDNQKSQLELDEIDALYPDEEDEAYLFPETETKIASKFDPTIWGYIV